MRLLRSFTYFPVVFIQRSMKGDSRVGILSLTPVALVGIFLLATAPTARAAVTYTYTGSHLVSFFGTQACPPVCNVTGSFTVAAPLAPNLSNSFVSAQSFSFTDGFFTITNANATTISSSPPTYIEVSTDSAGVISAWTVVLTGYQGSNVYQMVAQSCQTTGPSCGLVIGDETFGACTPALSNCAYDATAPAAPNGSWSTGTGSQSFVYVTNFKSNTISVFETSTNSLVSTIPVGNSPRGIVLSPDGAFAYVAHETIPGSISVINTQSDTVSSTIPVGPLPTGLAITPNGRFVYVADTFSPGAVTVIDTTTNSVVATIPEGIFPNEVAISPDGAFAYVTTLATPAYVSVISTATNLQVATIPVGPQPTGIAITPNGAFAYVTDIFANNVDVIDLKTNTVVSTIPVGVTPGRVSITPDGTLAYVSNYDSNSVSVIDTRTNKVVTTVPVGVQPKNMAFTSDGLLAYVANTDLVGGQGSVSVIDTISRTVVTTLAAGNVPNGVAAAPPPPASTGCIFSLSPATQSIGPQGGLGSFMINAAAGCQWGIGVNASWITLFSPVASPGGGSVHGTGSQRIVYTVSSDGGVSRSGTISVGNVSFRVDQQGFAATCTFSISPSLGAFASTGGNLTIFVTVPPGISCPWAATSNAPWLTVLSGASGAGSGSITLHAAPNAGAARTGTVTIAGQAFSATQAAPGATACGAVDVSSQTNVQPGQQIPIPWSNYYSQSITVRNASGSVIRGPVFVVTIGEPTHFGFPNDSLLIGGGPTTSCFSPLGDYLLLVSGDLQPGQIVSIPLVWATQSFTASIRYSTKVLSGIPSH